MYVCVCKAVTEREVRSAAKAGARTLHDLRRDLGVASECGRCARCAHQLLCEARAAAAACSATPALTEPAAA